MFVSHPRFSHIKIWVTPPPVQGSTHGRSAQLEEMRRRFERDPLGTHDYGRGVRDIVNYIAGRLTGRIILQALQATGRTMRIQPYQPTEENPLNASASADDLEAATPRGETVLQCSGSDTGQPRGLIFHPEGTGRGSDVTVRFTPSMWTSVPTTQPRVTGAVAGPGSRSDQVLLHEMLHGYRQMMGLLLCTATNDQYDTTEEYFAIVVTNIYVSEVFRRSNVPLRAHHHGFTALPYASLFPDDQINQQRLRKIRTQCTSLTTDLALRSRAVFNPFRDLFLINQPQARGPAMA